MPRRIVVFAIALAASATAALVGAAPPAQAATADRWGFAYVKDPLVPVWTTLDTARQWGSWKTAFPGLWADGIRLAPGRFLVRFPQVGTGSRGVVHVTPVNRTGHYCEVVRWFQSGADEIIDVQCHRPGGVNDDTPFTVLWTFSTGIVPTTEGTHGYVQNGSAGLVQAYNSTGGPVTVTAGGVGQYLVRFSGVGVFTTLAGNIQVSAVQPNAGPRRCKVYRWGASGSDILAYVFCYNQAGALVASEFTASYHRERAVFGSFAPPKYFGYIWSPAAGQTNFNYPAGGFGFNSVGAIPPLGRFLVKYPFLGLAETHAQVTASGLGSNYCHLTQAWTLLGGDAQVDVVCFDNAGVLTPHDFLSTFTSRA